MFHCKIWNSSNGNGFFQTVTHKALKYFILSRVMISPLAYLRWKWLQLRKRNLHLWSIQVEMGKWPWLWIKGRESESRCRHCFLSQIFLLRTLQCTKIGQLFLQPSAQLFTGCGLGVTWQFFFFFFSKALLSLSWEGHWEGRLMMHFCCPPLCRVAQPARRPRGFCCSL